MRYTTPQYSQFLDVKDKEWKGKSCGIVSLKMLMDYWLDNPSAAPEKFEELINEGLGCGGYVPGVGWRHKELADVARSHGLDGENFDWTDEHVDVAFNKVVPHLAVHPVMASIYRDLNGDEPGHLVVLTGYEDGRISYNDPDSKKRKDVERSVPLQEFLDGWKKRIVLIHPKDCICDKEEK